MDKYLKTINKVSALFTQNPDFEQVMYKTLVLLSKETGMQRGMISINRRDLQEIHVEITYGIPTDRNSPIFYRLGEGITGKVVETGRPIAIPKLDQEPLFLDRSGARTQMNRSDLAFICVPIIYGKDIVGALSVDRTAHNADLETEVPFLETISNILASRVHLRRIKDENIRLREAIERQPSGTIIGNSDAMRELAYLIAQVADSDATVLITGETGTGKGLTASEIHRRSTRKKGPFLKINCGAIPENLIEMELFGHEKGAFTGAVGKKIGKFELANRGTIFLDEIGELPLASQVKLLRVLEDKKVERVGGTQTINVDVRVLTATNRNLENEIDSGNFRADLYYRLNVFPIHVPPLRERGADIILLADFFVHHLSNQLKRTINRIDSSALDLLISYHWPGNVRELQNCIERAILMSKDNVIYGYLLPASLQRTGTLTTRRGKDSFKMLVQSYETTLIIDALKEAKGNQTQAATILGTTKRVIQYKIQQYGIDYRKFTKIKID
ncbi:MAG: sigma 54-interacting transcriptional regulator [Candidatus Magnetomorum sp.]|nr:sigma 54-interacting transcriptional regulator [Candidatus Magnetomorum sp.]